MNMELLNQEIAKIEASIDAYDEVDSQVAYACIDTITKAGFKEEAVEPLLQLIERHPAAYFGDPGMIVHFIEQFRGRYETYLIESLRRIPAITTVEMANRCINDGSHAQEFLDILRDAAANPEVGSDIRDRARDYLEFQAGK
ncbi:MAG: hypothetical protein K2P63_10440 [Lachnospiraceae bacterium]|nr:hypothetical protein [Lachnospiraceae bacterium]